MFNIYFKEYSEKVWGIDCSRISQSWVAKRIKGLSLGTAVKNAFFKFTGREIATLADTFFYPKLGIGRIAERLGEEIRRTSPVLTSSGVTGLHHDAGSITGIEVQNCKRTYHVEGSSYISTIPMNALVKMMDPAPPEEVSRAAASLGYRDLLTVSVMVDRENVTDQNWVYIPEKKYLFGRLHEPKVWSRSMAPEGKTLVVVEFFCFKDDHIWSRPDEELSRITIEGLEELGFINRDEVLGTDVLRVSKAYPLFEVGYEKHCEVIYDYLSRFDNLHIAGRSGMFQYQNMDHAIESGMEAAESLLGTGRS
jgi:protoporphyrinogen oxidase